jgi:hypothetical protein
VKEHEREARIAAAARSQPHHHGAVVGRRFRAGEHDPAVMVASHRHQLDLPAPDRGERPRDVSAASQAGDPRAIGQRRLPPPAVVAGQQQAPVRPAGDRGHVGDRGARAAQREQREAADRPARAGGVHDRSRPTAMTARHVSGDEGPA